MDFFLMDNKLIVKFLQNAISESTNYEDDDNIQPSMRTTVDGKILVAQIRSLLKLMEE